MASSFTRLMAASSCASIFAVMSAGCTSIGGSLPGSSGSVNRNFFQNEQDFLERLDLVREAYRKREPLTMDNALFILGRERRELAEMNRTDIRGTLEGTGSSPVPLMQTALTEERLACKEGLAFEFSSARSGHAFVTPIRWEKATTGFNYKVKMIFNRCSDSTENKSSRLETLVVEGGRIDTKSTTTVFDFVRFENYFTPFIKYPD